MCCANLKRKESNLFFYLFLHKGVPSSVNTFDCTRVRANTVRMNIKGSSVPSIGKVVLKRAKEEIGIQHTRCKCYVRWASLAMWKLHELKNCVVVGYWTTKGLANWKCLPCCWLVTVIVSWNEILGYSFLRILTGLWLGARNPKQAHASRWMLHELWIYKCQIQLGWLLFFFLIYKRAKELVLTIKFIPEFVLTSVYSTFRMRNCCATVNISGVCPCLERTCYMTTLRQQTHCCCCICNEHLIQSSLIRSFVFILKSTFLFKFHRSTLHTAIEYSSNHLTSPLSQSRSMLQQLYFHHTASMWKPLRQPHLQHVRV